MWGLAHSANVISTVDYSINKRTWSERFIPQPMKFILLMRTSRTIRSIYEINTMVLNREGSVPSPMYVSAFRLHHGYEEPQCL